MTKFIPVLDDELDHVNLAHVAFVKPARDGVHLYGADGKYLGKTRQEIPTDTIVPALPGCFAWVVQVRSEGLDIRPTRVEATRVMVVAWRIDSCDYLASPITAGLLANNTTFVELPNGHLERCGVDAYATVEDAKADILDCAQRGWDRNQEKRPIPVTTA